jgi:hypothetical protein
MSERPNCNRQMGRSNPPAGSTFHEAIGHSFQANSRWLIKHLNSLIHLKRAGSGLWSAEIRYYAHGVQRLLLHGVAETPVHESQLILVGH